MSDDTQILTPILPCNDVQVSKAFYLKLGFTVHWEDAADPQGYVILGHPSGAALHLNKAVEGWLVPGRNPFGLYLYVETVDEIAAIVGCEAKNREWGMYEAAFSDPDQTLVRVGWPISKRQA
ncbi:glyoxalase [Asticcacaulis sp. EMRT-3]|uniref:glyoxalase n=1 Tax=Asticcacaulis sp. EMRT-3 TaxID=3040349 RepID=UPI0024AFF066|nr:glyoxalase [Asticcacaulis sp. EMRT-3]MDI7773817.1 glyoxalase [Asticcacaulis sp. EMRT-3]